MCTYMSMSPSTNLNSNDHRSIPKNKKKKRNMFDHEYQEYGDKGAEKPSNSLYEDEDDLDLGADSVGNTQPHEKDDQPLISSDPIQPGDEEKGSKFLWFTMLLFGAGFLFPFNTYIVASDFWDERYDKYNPEFYIPLVYIWTGNFVLIINTFFIMDRVSAYNRIRLGYAMFITGFIFFPIIEESVLDNRLSREGGFAALLTTVALPAIGTGMQQGTFYGMASVLGSSNTIAMMLGETVSGFAVSLVRIITKAAFNEDTVSVASTYVFLGISSAFIVSCIFLSEYVYKLDYVEKTFGRVFNKPSKNQNDTETNPEGKPTEKIDQFAIMKTIKYPMVSVVLAFFVQMVLFPGVVTSQPPTTLGSWTSVVHIFAFNFGDMVGRLLPFSPWKALSPESWSAVGLIRFGISMLLFIPLLMLTAVPYGDPYIAGEFWVILFTFTLAVMTGYLGTLAMVAGPELCPPEHREVAGNLMNLALFTGLSLGVTTSIGLLHIIKY
eukprot:m.131713 g.131713  ORF g.131713 m.131713 type:complete len:494 (+) comp29561_c0_seq2:42-1523(+)